MIYASWPLWAQIVVAPFAFVALVAGVLIIDVIVCRLVDDALRSLSTVHEPRTWEHTPTRLRIATERYRNGSVCPSCHFATREIVVVRLYDDVARVCPDCAAVLAPEVAA